MPDQTWVTRICGLGADGAEIIRREVPDDEINRVPEVSDWVSCLAGVEKVTEQARRYY